VNRRQLLLAAAASLVAAPSLGARAPRHRPIDLIQAQSNLGLRPNEAGALPGTARAAGVLIESGLARALRFRRTETVTQRPYVREAEPGTKLRNGSSIRAFNLELAGAVARSRRSGGFPLIVGGECSNLLGALLGLRRTGGRGLVHLDGHSDFLQPAFYPPDRPLHSAAGMDLALATGRGEPLLTRWPGIAGPLAADADSFQLGERYSDPPDRPTPLFNGTAITQLTLQRVRQIGLDEAARQIADHLARRRIRAGWLHIDVDILDQAVMPAVDSPGTPGLDFAELAALVRAILATDRIGGADVAIYDPDLDPDRRYARGLVQCLGAAFTP
jgi:arginase